MKITKYLLFLLLSIVSYSFGQNSELYPPPQYENTYLFKILKYNRQPKLPSNVTAEILNTLEKPIENWDSNDSLLFAYENVHLQKYQLAMNIFSRLDTDFIIDKYAQVLYRVALFQTKRYTRLKEYNNITLEANEFYGYKDAFMDITNAYIAYKKDRLTLDTITIFPILKADTLKSFNRNDPPNTNKLVGISFAIDSAFRQFTILHDGKDFVLSKAFEEMGDFQKKYFYTTNAFFYYSASLNYDKSNTSSIEKYNSIKKEMNAKNYISLSFKNIFGKVIKNRYQLKNGNIKSKEPLADTYENYIPPPQQEEKKDFFPWIGYTELILLILGLMILGVIFFVRSKK